MKAFSLRVGLSALLAVALAPALVLVVVAGWEARKDQVVAAKDHAQRLARSISATQMQVISGTRSLLAALSNVPEVRSRDWAACWQFLPQLAKDPAYGAYTGLGVFDADGNLVCNSTPVDKPINVADRAWFKNTLATAGFTSSGYVIGRSSNRPILPFGYPLKDERGRVVGAILAAVGIGWINDVLFHTILPEGARVTVLDRDGVVLARYPAVPSLIGQPLPVPWLRQVLDADGEGTIEVVGMDGNPRLYAYTPLDQSGAKVLVSFDRTRVLAAADQAERQTWLWMGLIGAGALGAAWIAGALILRPVRRLLLVTQALASGDLGYRTGQVAGAREFQDLQRAFDEMAERLALREADLKGSQARVELLLNSVGEGICGLDPQGRITFANPEARRLLGWEGDGLIGGDLHRLVHHTGGDGIARSVEHCSLFRAIREGKAERVVADRFWHRSGTRFPVDFTVTPILDDRGPEGAVVVFRDISEREWAEAKLRRSEVKFRSLFDGVNDAIFFHDLEGRLKEVNRAACDDLGYSREDLLRLSLRDLDAADGGDHTEARLHKLAETGDLVFETVLLRRDGSRIPVEVNARLVEFNGVPACLSVARDISERKIAEARTRHFATHDPLTDLPNRLLFEEHLDYALRQAQRLHQSLVVLYLDLDRFKQVNDSLGHAAGDQLLVGVAERLRACVRDSDMVARLGGDEFVIILSNVLEREGVATVADKIVQALSWSFRLGDNQTQISQAQIGASIGIARYPEDAETGVELVRLADAAMYRAKAAGRSGFCFVRPAGGIEQTA